MTGEDRIQPPPDGLPRHSDRVALPGDSTTAPGRLHVEVLDRRARLRMRTRIDNLPCVVGRAYSCGIVLDDPFISPEHASILRRPDGTVVVEDLGSTNGIYDLRTGKLVASLEVGAGTTIRVGQTLLRFHAADEPVEPARLLPRIFSTPGWSALLAVAAVLGIAELSTYLATYGKLTPGPFVLGAVALALALVSWTAIWALLSRVLQHQSYFAEHCIVVCFFVSLYILADWVTDYYAFAFAADRSVSVMEWALEATISAGLLYGHLRFCSTLSSPQLLIRAAGVAGAAAGLAGLVVLAESLEPEWTAAASFRGGLKPPLFRLASSDDLDGFFARVEQLKTRVDAVAAEGEQ